MSETDVLNKEPIGRQGIGRFNSSVRIKRRCACQNMIAMRGDIFAMELFLEEKDDLKIYESISN